MNNIQSEIKICKDYDMMMEFLKAVDYTLPVPLSKRVDLEKFCRNSIEKHIVYYIEQDKKIACAAIFYYNFQSKAAAYLDLLATVPEYNGRGYAKQIMNAIESAAKDAGMTEFHLHTNDTNAAALNLYTKLGYEVIAHDPKVHMMKQI